MTTSITDARFTSLHFTPGHLLSLSIDDEPETGWSVMPGYDQTLPIPYHLEPPRLDADETLPSQLHPSYPFGRPPTVGKPLRPWMSGPGNLLGTIGEMDGSSGLGRAGMIGSFGRGDAWDELAMRGIIEVEQRKEVPPGMAGAKRPPSPPSPSLHPSLVPGPRSFHLRNHLARQRQASPSAPVDPFDAPVPNETFVGEEQDPPAPEEGQAIPQGGAAGNVGGTATQAQGATQREGTQNRPERGQTQRSQTTGEDDG
ncbi:hypothetical protein BD324DRAFT_616692 [Kockovaella imperatae]|uniref:Uncharacterized protein n=1 Tax=Kockovaella imperatae TaxID=4999 RepID=A0A1Y1URR1_9TREE|nr:hypothetical protein BD324DRAFT_616692 [Kockovaella imperatae]ORX40184.1 hypothetical protein BD324DRAFT_616692 [Kockovaella imperatae]